MYLLQQFPSTSSSISAQTTEQSTGVPITCIPSDLIYDVHAALPAIQNAIKPLLPKQVVPLCNHLLATWVLASTEQAECEPCPYLPIHSLKLQQHKQQHRGIMRSRFSRWILRPFKRKTAHVAPMDLVPKRNISEPFSNHSSSSNSSSSSTSGTSSNNNNNNSECSCLLSDTTAAVSQSPKVPRQKISGLISKLGKKMKTAVSRRQIDHEEDGWTRLDLSHKPGVDAATQTLDVPTPHQELCLYRKERNANDNEDQEVKEEEEDGCSSNVSYNSADENVAEGAISSDDDMENGSRDDEMKDREMSPVRMHGIHNLYERENEENNEIMTEKHEDSESNTDSIISDIQDDETGVIKESDSIHDLLSLNHQYFQFAPSINDSGSSSSNGKISQQQQQQQQQQQIAFHWLEPNVRQLRLSPNLRTPWSPPANAAPAVLLRPIKTSKTDMDVNPAEPVPFPKIGLGRQGKATKKKNDDSIDVDDPIQYRRSASSRSFVLQWQETFHIQQQHHLKINGAIYQ
ncbi:hypothetical protein DFQ30_004730 [Apophysomyces sp. BC1015]|nr:hypothetical protein DFQ30_004730 [Apophysomyces sp. BC1015]